jgi:hypothetical protein
MPTSVLQRSTSSEMFHSSALKSMTVNLAAPMTFKRKGAQT